MKQNQDQQIVTNKRYLKLLHAPYKLIAFISVVVILIITFSIYSLYLIGLEEQKKRLSEIVQSHAAMITVTINHQKNINASALESMVLKDLMYAQENFMGFGKTGEYTLATLKNNTIHFLLRHRFSNLLKQKLIPLDDKRAEPMRRALQGNTGTLIGLDYQGHTVVAAHVPIPSVHWGIVAKIDLSEIQAPYVHAAMYGIFGGLIVILFGSFVILYFTQPIAKEIENSRAYNRTLFDSSPIGLALTDLNGKMIDVNSAFVALTQYSKEEILSLTYWDITPEKYLQQEKEQLHKLMIDGHYGPYEKEYIRKDGSLVPVRLSGSMIEQTGTRYIWSSIEDITQQKQDEQTLKEAALVFDHTHEGIMITDANIKCIRINKTFTDITGYTQDDIKGKNPGILKSGSYDKTFYKEMWDEINSKGTWYGEMKNRRKNGEFFIALQSITAVKDANNVTTGYVSVFSDISERKTHETSLAYMASHDSLTDLPNRSFFHETLKHAIEVAKRNENKLAVFFLDLNRFKDINDTLGHKIGDKLLQIIGKRIQASLRAEDTVSRLGGDEFAIILPELKHIKDAVIIAEKIIGNVSKELVIESHPIEASISIGISIYPDHTLDREMLLQCADKAMYKAKHRKTNFYEIYEL